MVGRIPDIMNISTYISVRWGQLFGYSAGAVLALQSVKSTYLGCKSVCTALTGSETYQERVHQAANDQLNILSNFKIFIVGSDSFSRRFSHLTSGLENFSIAFITALFSYLLFFKAFEGPLEQVPPPPDTSTLNEAHIKNLEMGQQASSAFKNDNCHISNFFNPTSRSKLTKCEEQGYFTDYYFLPDNLTYLDTSKLYDILSCLKEFSYFQRMKAMIQTPNIQTKLLQKVQDRAQLAIDEVQHPAQSDLSTISSNSGPSTLQSDSVKRELKGILDDYIQDFFVLHDSVLNNYAKYVEGHKHRLEHFIATNMTYSRGPFDIHLEKVCDDHIMDHLFFLKPLETQYCTKYHLFKKALQLAYNQKSTIDDLDPHFSTTDCHREVFSKLFINPNPVELKLPPNLFEALKRLQSELNSRTPQS